MRKLASVQRISAIESIPDADKVELAKVGGWNIVVQKGVYEVNQLICFYEIDSFLPLRPEYEFLRSTYKNTANLGEGFRLRTKKLRGVVSQGLIMPLNEVLRHIGDACASCMSDKEYKTFTGLYRCCQCPLQDMKDFNEGADLTKLLGVQLYEKPVPATMRGRIKGNFPHFIPKTDQERAQNLFKFLTHARTAGTMFQVTLKLDGSSMTVYNKDDIQGVCSRNWDMDPTEEVSERRSVFWECAAQNNLIEKVKAIKDLCGFNVALQGELMGEGVQGNREKLKGLHFYLFDIYNIDEERYLSPAKTFDLAHQFELKHVPFLGTYVLETLDMEGLLKLADQPSINKAIPAEGIVFKSTNGRRFTFKVINNKFLLSEKDE